MKFNDKAVNQVARKSQGGRAPRPVRGNENSERSPVAIAVRENSGRFFMETILIEHPQESPAAAKWCLADWEKHEADLNHEVQWLREGSNDMTPEFVERMWLMVMEEDTYNRVKNNLSPEQARKNLEWMLKNRYNKLQKTKDMIRELQGMVADHEEAANNVGCFHNNDDDRDNAPGVTV
jgi:hypothetical protein